MTTDLQDLKKDSSALATSSNNERCDADMAAFFDAFNFAAMYTETFDFADADALAQDFTDKIITALRRDPRWAGLRRIELDLLLADIRKRFAQDMFAQFGGLAPYNELRRAAGEAFAEVSSGEETDSLNVHYKNRR
jgi:hypothetical protein